MSVKNMFDNNVVHLQNKRNVTMGKVKINRMVCRHPSLFKAMWGATMGWLVMSVTNYFGYWLLPEMLDSFGMVILGCFGISLYLCFSDAIHSLVRQYKEELLSTTIPKITKYSLAVSFVVLLLYSMWKFSQVGDDPIDPTSNGAVSGIPRQVVGVVVACFIQAFIVSVFVYFISLFLKICFVQFAGRIRRIGIETLLGFGMIGYLIVFPNDSPYVNVIVVLIAMAFLYDIWRFADFQERLLTVGDIKRELENASKKE